MGTASWPRIGNHQPPAGTVDPVNNWTSDGTYPATVSDHKMVVSGSGTATVTARVANTGPSGGTGRIKRNGTEIGSAALPGSTTTTITVTGVSLTDGDLLHLAVTSSGTNMTVQGTNTWLDANPA